MRNLWLSGPNRYVQHHTLWGCILEQIRNQSEYVSIAMFNIQPNYCVVMTKESRTAQWNIQRTFRIEIYILDRTNGQEEKANSKKIKIRSSKSLRHITNWDTLPNAKIFLWLLWGAKFLNHGIKIYIDMQ
jgi:hypothetical protein